VAGAGVVGPLVAGAAFVANIRSILLDATRPFVMPRAKVSKVLKSSVVMKAFLIVCSLRLFKDKS
jgi:hypothetical protein